MPQVNREELEIGMQVAEEIRDKRGRVLMPPGVLLEEKHLRALKMWGVESVAVLGDEKAEAEQKAREQIDPEALERVRAQVNEMFRLNYENRSNPMFKIFFLECVRRMTKMRKMEDSALLRSNSATAAEADILRKRILSGGAGNLPKSVDLVHRTKSLASLPAVYQELMEVVNHPHSSAADVANVISSDPGLTARLLRIVNSTFYSFPGKIETVSRAITIVGTAQLCDLALATSVMKMFGKSMDGIMDMGMFWRHSVACGVVARLLASRRREPNVESFFIMGLLHDIGRLIMYSQLPAISRVTVMEAHDNKKPLYAAERDVLGYSHADVGMDLLEAWNLPISQREAIGYHHRPLRAGRFPLEAALIHIADFIACSMRIGRGTEVLVPPMVPEAWDQLGVDATILADLMKDCDGQVSDLMRIFEQD